MVRNTGRTLTVNMTVAINLVAPITRQCTIQLDPNMTAQSEVFVPTTENWVITDCYILAAFGATGTTNPQIEFIKDRGVSMGITTPLSALLIANNTRPRFLPTPIGYEAGSILTIQGITTTDNNATADDINFYVAVDIT